MFVTLATTLHFGQAAERLGCSQPALSRGIQKLEADLGVALFDRDSRKVRLTAAGEGFLEGAGAVLDAVEAAARGARTAGRALFGRLVLGIGLCGQHPEVGGLVRRFRELHPETPVSLVTLSEPDIPAALAEGTTHAVIAVDWAMPAGCRLWPLFETELQVLAPEGGALAQRLHLEPRDLDGQDLVFPSRRLHPMIAERFREFCSQHRIRPRTEIEVDSIEQVFGLVAGGAGIGYLPLPDRFSYPGLALRRLQPAYPLRYVVGWRRSNPLVEGLTHALGDPVVAR